MVTQALGAPDKINIFSCSMSWNFQPSQYFVNIAFAKWPRNAMKTGAEPNFQWYLRGILRVLMSKTFFFLTRFVSIFIFAAPWPRAWTSLCRHLSFGKHIDMFGWTAVDWTGHWSMSSDGHIWSLCTMSTAYHVAELSFTSLLFLAFCEWTFSDSVWPVQISEAVDFFGGTFPAEASIREAQLWPTTWLAKLHSHFLQAALRHAEHPACWQVQEKMRQRTIPHVFNLSKMWKCTNYQGPRVPV